MKRPTREDVAREAKVGSATVDRVLNGRGSVRPELAERVLKAAKRLNYGARPARRHGVIRIEVILGWPEHDFHAELNRCFKGLAASLDPSIVLHRTFIPLDDVGRMAKYIAEPGFRRSGLIVVAPRHPDISESLRKASLEGVEIIQFMNRCSDLDIPYVGIDNYAAGQTAGYFASKMSEGRSGNFIILGHSDAFWVNSERTRGFNDYISAQRDKGHSFSGAVFCNGNHEMVARKLREMLDADPHIIGLYSTAPTRPIASVLESQKRKIFWIGHWLSEHTARCLRSGLMDLVFDQAPEILAQRAVQTLLCRLGLIEIEVNPDPVQFVTVTALNLPRRLR